MSWNGLAFTAAAEISGRARAGTAMSLQNTILAVGGALAPSVFGAVVEATSWTSAFAVLALAPLVAVFVLRPLEGDEDARIAERERVSPNCDSWRCPDDRCHAPPLPEVRSGLEGVVAFATTIAEPDREGGALRYRGVDVEDLVGTVPFEQVWGLLVDGTLLPGPPARRAAPARRPVGRPARRRPGRARDARRPSGASARSSTSPTSRRATTSRARR